MTNTITHSPTENAESSSMQSTSDPDPEVAAIARGPRQFSPSYKARIVAEYSTLDKQAKGALLRREGLYSSVVANWCRRSELGSMTELAKSSGRQLGDPKDKEIAGLRKVNSRLTSDLDKAHKVIEIQGKLSALLDQLATDNANTQLGEAK